MDEQSELIFLRAKVKRMRSAIQVLGMGAIIFIIISFNVVSAGTASLFLRQVEDIVLIGVFTAFLIVSVRAMIVMRRTEPAYKTWKVIKNQPETSGAVVG